MFKTVQAANIYAFFFSINSGERSADTGWLQLIQITFLTQMVQDVPSFHGSVNDTAGSLAVTDVEFPHRHRRKHPEAADTADL